MQHFRASICFWTTSLIVKVASKNQYPVLREGYRNSSADGWLHQAGCISCWMQTKSSAYGLTCCSSVANCRVKSSSSAHHNRMWNMTALRISAFSCWNVAAVAPRVSAWRSSCLLCPWLPVGGTVLAWFSSAALRSLAWLGQGQDLPLDVLEGANCWAKCSPGDSAGKLCSTQIVFLKCCCYVFRWAPNFECRAEVHLALQHNIGVSLQGILFLKGAELQLVVIELGVVFDILAP